MDKNIQYKKLGEVCDFIAGGTPLKSKIEYWKGGNIPWIKISDLKEKYVKFSDEKITKKGLEKSSAKILKKGTILYTIFASVGKVAILDIEATTNQAIVGINLKKDIFINRNFLYYFLCSIENNIKNKARGVAQNNINISILKNINIPIFSLSLQQNIVKILSKIENLLEHLKQKKLFINILNKSLFTRMFGDIKSNDKNWKIYKFSEKLKISSGGTPSKANKIYWENGTISWIGSNMCNDEVIIKNDGKFITEEGLKNSSAKIYKINTVIVALVGATIGKTGLLKFETSTNQNIAALEIKNMDYSPEFLFFLLQNLYYKFTELGGGTFKMANLNFIKNLPLISPPIELQNKFAKRVEKIEKLSFEIENSIKEAENLYNSLMNKYFE